MKRNALTLPLLVFLCISGFIFLGVQSAGAALKLQLESGATTITVEDNQAGDTSADVGVVGFNGSIDGFDVAVVTGISKPVVGGLSLAQLDFSAVTVASDSGGTLTISLTDTDYGPSSGDTTLRSEIGGTTNGTTTFQGYLDPANTEFGMDCTTGFQGPFGGAFDDTVTSPCTLSGPFSLTAVAEVSLGPGSVQSFGASIKADVPPVEVGACRMTGGNATVSPAIGMDGLETWTYDYTGAQEESFDTGFWITTGGQINAPSGNQPPSGHWEHTQHGGAEGNFSFHVGTSSAPEGTQISTVECNDPGWCVQARCAPFKQLFWTGIGNFANQHFGAVFPGCTVVKGNKGTQHFVKVMIGDFGENDRPTREASLVDADPDTCNWFGKLKAAGFPGPPGPFDAASAVFLDSAPDDPFGDKGGQVCDKCPDYYQIEIYCTTDPGSDVIYRFQGFLQHGNYQLHPATGEQCPAIEALVPEFFESESKGGGKKK
jgi:hypothetical protein